VATDTGYVITVVSSQHAVDIVSLYRSIAFDFMSNILLFVYLVYVLVLRVFMSVGSVATELAETDKKTCHVEAAAWNLSSKPGVMSYEDALEAMKVYWRELRLYT